MTSGETRGLMSVLCVRVMGKYSWYITTPFYSRSNFVVDYKVHVVFSPHFQKTSSKLWNYICFVLMFATVRYCPRNTRFNVSSVCKCRDKTHQVHYSTRPNKTY